MAYLSCESAGGGTFKLLHAGAPTDSFLLFLKKNTASSSEGNPYNGSLCYGIGGVLQNICVRTQSRDELSRDHVINDRETNDRVRTCVFTRASASRRARYGMCVTAHASRNVRHCLRFTARARAHDETTWYTCLYMAVSGTDSVTSWFTHSRTHTRTHAYLPDKLRAFFIEYRCIRKVSGIWNPVYIPIQYLITVATSNRFFSVSNIWHYSWNMLCSDMSIFVLIVFPASVKAGLPGCSNLTVRCAL